ncbi:SDR family oxidoreductase [Aquimarina sp. BL5]|uniref:SDR family oxidoreductase n=1 Tax=Aquimarina sp. BL5 TaxID=1714860 RepID=UPI000E48688B|nr:SDR family oxidoreductase [Aquimarina sp. BL5]AXT51794.1 SDR family oxidoreductase [Aquimarina sp. BL5]RKN11815.1 SDR family oxidoreductase [Aquimarina sp. BL5]
MRTLENKIALITGSSRGLGKEMAIRLAQQGADILVTYNSNRTLADETVKEIRALGQKALAFQLNVGDITLFDAFFTEIKNSLSQYWNTSKFDILVNNAGIIANEMVAETSETTFDNLVNIQLKGPFFITQKALPLLNDGGRIINISTGLARFSLPGYGAYSSMKAGIEALTRYLAKELGSRQITANVVAPGAINTDMNKDALENNPELEKILSSVTALGRVGVAKDIGGIVAFLASEDARWINGQRIEASGGMFL